MAGSDAELLVEWGEMFIEQLPEDDPGPRILRLNGRSSHVYRVEFFPNDVKARRACNVLSAMYSTRVATL